MEVYNVGRAEEMSGGEEISRIDPAELDDFEGEWAVVAYFSGFYNGSGEMIIKIGNELRLYNLSHYSCYGPLEGGWNDEPKEFDVFSVEDFLSGDIHKCSTYKSVNEK